MIVSPSHLVIDTYIRTNQIILNFLKKCTDDHLHWRLQPGHHSIAFHAWYVSRWSDHFHPLLQA